MTLSKMKTQYSNCIICKGMVYVYKKYTQSLSSQIFFHNYRAIYRKNIGYLCGKCYRLHVIKK
ncbi:ORF-35 peptide [Chrysodeixis chalcites nucleopolyhedrovirus]|uniref:ORF-35 peptide n=1 Tax=Chrysodeixis chalcites nucleopolyhedrovirus TaxID=320432 RepID=Q4KT45_9ABAC|nr:ORF-35 peptide [Chrysodeixis chalcites nucleopolyhedrovirus]AAY83966.1 ORF-35 peptide [Chrysodeixis chalcites nucleopolyhedrovirus]AGC36250.1 hypothetical protein TF1A_0035 [Chrysodeixis chalcites SNPV TF1-A]AGE61446.1 hypothetical protein [Chrysodeixis chalcites nucleopolyhedrovirus]AGE61595.1 hypothetical protein [Chrysodeixis chalcites nucleopolyhedrovirus]